MITWPYLDLERMGHVEGKVRSNAGQESHAFAVVKHFWGARNHGEPETMAYLAIP